MLNDVAILIPGREISLGGFNVKRVLPYAKKRMVGPFIFWDHMGLAVFAKGYGMTVSPHPHIGLSTLTYLLEGRIQHRDSLGNEVVIRPGEVNWMTAGHGIAHSERTLESDLADEHKLHGMQLWIALPDDQEDREPSFVHIERSQIPALDLGPRQCLLVAGSAHGKSSPVPVYSPLFLIDARCESGENFKYDPDGQELGIYVATGSVELVGDGGFRVAAGSMAVLSRGSSVEFRALENSQVFVFGGEPFKSERHVWWNFVSSSKVKIEEAKRRWEEDKFPPVINESKFSRIPLPKA